MRIEALTIEQLRLFDRIELHPAAGINVLIGDNGAGKTSILEAIHVLSSGRSFRGSVRDALIRHGESELRVFAQLDAERESRKVRLGLARGPRRWEARVDGQPVTRLSRLFHELAVVCFEPNSHALVSGSSENRRRFVDWALFHVEPSFIEPWRRYQRALRQRNALLKQVATDAQLEPWDMELAQHGVSVERLRGQWLEAFRPTLAAMSLRFLPELGAPRLLFQASGSSDADAASLHEALRNTRARDRALGHTTVGPHRSDWSIGFEQLRHREMFSRGQEKLVVLACLLAQAESFAASRGQWPVLLLDDLPSELDATHLAATLAWLARVPAQAFVSMTAAQTMPTRCCRASGVFHVEQGRLRPLV